MDGGPVDLPKAPALGFAITACLGDPSAGDPQVTLQTHFDRDAPEADVNRGVDAIVRVVQRQRAIAEIDKLEKQNRISQQMVDQDSENVGAAEAAHAAETRKLRAELAELNGQAPGIREKDEAEWRASGRAGDYKPTNAATSALNGLKKQATDTTVKLNNLELERADARRTIANKAAGWLKEIARNNEEIARLRKIVG